MLWISQMYGFFGDQTVGFFPHSKLEAFQIRAYGKALVDGQSPWGQIRPGKYLKNVTNFLDFQHFHWKVIYIFLAFSVPIIFEVGE